MTAWSRYQYGPVQNKMQFRKVKGYIDDARAHGKIVAGGNPHSGLAISCAQQSCGISRKTPAWSRKSSLDRCCRCFRYSSPRRHRPTNTTAYGLGGTVWSSIPIVPRDGQALDSGTVWVNKHLDLLPNVPFGGAKQSGIGAEMAQEGLEEFTQLQVISR